jgi:predicted dehydrogenase
MKKVTVGVVGCGMISDEYLRGMQIFEILDVLACADLDQARARMRAEEFGVERACSPQQLLEDPEIEIVVNLTPPAAHAQINGEAIAAGKHVYTEKPLAITVEEGLSTVSAARERGVLVGCAPDTVLGGTLQTVRKLVDDGAIGRPVAASACFQIPGPEYLVPDASAWYQAGVGPMMDMGPYYITSLISLLGPARRVSGSVSGAGGERTAGLGPLAGTKLPVHVPTHVTGTVEFASGAVATVTMSWEVWGTTIPFLEIYGTQGSLTGPDPDYYDRSVRVLTAGQTDWQEVELTHDSEVERGIGVADMAYALRSGRPHRANGDVALHALEIMRAFEKSSVAGAHVTLSTTCERPAALPAHLPHGVLDP